MAGVTEEAHRLRWGLDAPAAVTGDEAKRLEAFQATRDILFHRLEALFR